MIIAGPAYLTCGQLEKIGAAEAESAAKANRAYKCKVGEKVQKHKGKRANPIDVDSGGDESDAMNYDSSLKGKFSQAGKLENKNRSLCLCFVMNIMINFGMLIGIRSLLWICMLELTIIMVF